MRYKDEIEIVGINDITSAKNMAHLLKYDSIYGRMNAEVSYDDAHIIVDGKKYPYFCEKDVTRVDWDALGADIVVEASGKYIDADKARVELGGSVKKVLITAPAQHGSNDAQKAMGIIALALLSGGYIDTLEIPIWVKMACATSMALGTSAGGWRIISTMGTKIFKMESINGFAADLNSSLVIFTATFLHLPVSTTHESVSPRQRHCQQCTGRQRIDRGYRRYRTVGSHCIPAAL